jgi:hypothetical protein
LGVSTKLVLWLCGGDKIEHSPADTVLSAVREESTLWVTFGTEGEKIDVRCGYLGIEQLIAQVSGEIYEEAVRCGWVWAQILFKMLCYI